MFQIESIDTRSSIVDHPIAFLLESIGYFLCDQRKLQNRQWTMRYSPRFRRPINRVFQRCVSFVKIRQNFSNSNDKSDSMIMYFATIVNQRNCTYTEEYSLRNDLFQVSFYKFPWLSCAKIVASKRYRSTLDSIILSCVSSLDFLRNRWSLRLLNYTYII